MRSKLPAQRSSRAISILRRSSPVVTRPKFLSHPNPSSKRCPREKNHPPQTGRLARNPARTASVDAAADAVVDAAEAVAQAFTPAAAKGIIPEVGVHEVGADAVEEDGAEEAAAEESTPEGSKPKAQPAPQAPRAPAAVPAASTRPPKGIVVLAIGLPGSGKSSWFKRHNVVALSSDMVRSLLFDDVREQRFQDLVFSNLRSMLKARLIAKRPMNYVDATNLTPQERQHWIKLAKDYQYEVHAVFFDVPLDVCLERHQRRDRVVPEDVMRRMAAKLKAPAFEEGFAKITVVRVKKKESEAERLDRDA